jgi:4-hydroxy-2-oxoglutarate aldolase
MTPLPGGIFPPIPTFFDDQGALDLPTLTRHVAWLATTPVAGILALGSNGEAMHLDDAERVAVIQTVRAAIDTQVADSVSESGDSSLLPGTDRNVYPPNQKGERRPWLLAGTADLSTRGTCARCRAAGEAGADAAVVLPPFAFPTQMSSAALQTHFLAVAEASPIPVVIYNMPANTANLDLSADLILELAQHPNIVGVKDSSGQVWKLGRVAAEAQAGFAVLAGSGSYLIPTLSVGGTGAIAAVANIIPDLVTLTYDLWQRRFHAGSLAEAQEREAAARHLQAVITPLNQFVTATHGVAGLKAALQQVRGYGGAPRPPLLALPAGVAAQVPLLYDRLRLATAAIEAMA